MQVFSQFSETLNNVAFYTNSYGIDFM